MRGSSLGNKAPRTKKCSCENPDWSLFDFTTSKFQDNFTITLWCHHCDCLWDTKSLTDENWDLLNNKQQQEVIQVLKNQQNIQQRKIENIEAAIVEREKEIVTCHKKIDKLKQKIFMLEQTMPK